MKIKEVTQIAVGFRCASFEVIMEDNTSARCEMKYEVDKQNYPTIEATCDKLDAIRECIISAQGYENV